MNDLGTNIRVERARRRWTAADLSARSGVEMSTIYQIEQGKRPAPQLPTLQKIADAFGVSISTLIPAASVSESAQQSEAGPRAIRENQSSPASKDATAPRGAQVSQPAGGTAEAGAAKSAA